MPSISVIVPVYQVERFLNRCVDSILAQTFEDFELILVDDGSPDGCGAICDEYARSDSRVHVIHQKNGGLSAARNTGIDWAFAQENSQWLAFVDSDDWVHPEYLELLHRTAEQTQCRISACGFQKTDGAPLEEPEDWSIFSMDADDYYCGQIHDGLTAVAWNKLYHKSLFQNLRYPIGKLHEDEFTTYQAIYQAEKIGVTPARLYAYYQNPKGIMRSEWNARRMHVLEAFEQQILFAQSMGRERLLHKAVLANIFGITDQLKKAKPVFRKELRKKLRGALKLGRECGCFPKNEQTLWAYEEAYPNRFYWWFYNRFVAKK